MSKPHFKVIIVGGSVTGLTLAHSLHKIGVDFVILEKRPTVTPQEGASVGILPNGARVLDQLGLYGLVEEATAPLGATHIHFPDGFHFRSLYPKSMLENFGYPVAFLERRRLLEVLYDALPDKSKVLVDKTVSDIEQCDDDGKSAGVKVRTVDGHVYEGDLVVGADGVHSRTRSELWRMSSSAGRSEDVRMEKDRMSAEYSCVFGISRGPSGLTAGEQIMRMYDGRTLVVIPSKDDVVFWFLSRKLDRRYKYSEAPRFTLEDGTAACAELADAPLADGVRFGDVWKIRQTFNMVVLEENLLRTWSFGRVLCIGDSIHKMTVNLGQGANCAIEDVAILTNLLSQRLWSKRGAKPSGQELDALLRRFNEIHLSRVSHIYDTSWLIARVHARDGFVRKIIGRYVMPYFGHRFESRPFNMIANAAALDFLPLPRSSFPGWEKYKSKESKPAGPWTVVSRSILLLVGLAILSAWWRRA
ncbi:FAD-dependent urate hydroxylase [Colletotrichum tanaceti]|uniref:FAD-dependent urate hydroxylase n=1 Tax=Colletotrichum tanaceti TaxID=1306861 RepID=A0A4U6X2A0_9PEZI|nr:FAD-dependent urate hydroxylase [Colletotrichum tanaceti]TKW49124.1 FAD-dependent urate hydroxylase [Colletotrichum tanaceti]